MDATGTSVLFFFVLKLLLWGGLIIAGIGLIRSIVNSARERAEDQNKTYEDVLLTVTWRRRYAILLWIVGLFVAVFITAAETGYRPKTVVTPPSSRQVDDRLRSIDTAETPEIPESQPLSDSQRNPDDVSDKNETENQDAREKFKQLPNSD